VLVVDVAGVVVVDGGGGGGERAVGFVVLLGCSSILSY
jgi:hypothetical protein